MCKIDSICPSCPRPGPLSGQTPMPVALSSYSRHKTTSALRYLIFGSTFISSFQGASYNQDRFNSSKSPVIMILKIKTQVIVSPKLHA